MKRLGISVILILFLSASCLGLKNEPPNQTENVNPEIKTHFAYFQRPEFYESAYAESEKRFGKPANLSGPACGAIINHHLLAPYLIANILEAVATTSPITILLISPNHLSRGQANIQVSKLAWKTPYGLLEPQTKVVDSLVQAGTATNEESTIGAEHGLGNVTGFIKHSFPNAKIVAMAVKPEMPSSEQKKLSEKLNQLLPKDTLVVGSFDFSHHLTDQAARFHDAVSISILKSGDIDTVNKLDVDSQPGLNLVMKFCQLRSASRFLPLQNTNSAVETEKFDMQDTTSYITGVFLSGEAERPESTDLSFLMFGLANHSDSIIPFLSKKNPASTIEPIERFLFGQDITLLPQNELDKRGSYLLKGKYKVVFLGRKNPLATNKTNRGDISTALLSNNEASAFKATFTTPKLSKTISSPLIDINKNSTSIALGGLIHGSSMDLWVFPVKIDSGNVTLLPQAELKNIFKNSSFGFNSQQRNQIINKGYIKYVE